MFDCWCNISLLYDAPWISECKAGRTQCLKLEWLPGSVCICGVFTISKASKSQIKGSMPRRSYMIWLKNGMPISEAYTLRAAIHHLAKCYLQVTLFLQTCSQYWARRCFTSSILSCRRAHSPSLIKRLCDAQAKADAQAAIHVLSGEPCGDAGEMNLAVAYLRLGDACLAEKDHADRDCMAALEASHHTLSLALRIIYLKYFSSEARMGRALESMVHPITRIVRRGGPAWYLTSLSPRS